MASDFVTVAKVSDIPEGTVASFDVRGIRVAVANVHGTYHAFDDTCTHEYCSLSEGELDDATITCPCHFAQFDVQTGAVISPPAPSPVRTYRIRVQDDMLQIGI